MFRRSLVFIFLLFNLFFTQQECGATILINEFLADPPVGLEGDANRDGVTSNKDDEFVEIVNFGNTLIDISNWYLKDNVAVRHIFAPNTLLGPLECLVIFGGGNPSGFDVKVVVSSSGELSLNNNGDVISLFDSNNHLIDQVIYGSEGGKDQSLTRYPDGSGTWQLHTLLNQGNILRYSPGRRTDGQPFKTAVPEPCSALGLVIGTLALVFKKKISKE